MFFIRIRLSDKVLAKKFFIFDTLFEINLIFKAVSHVFSEGLLYEPTLFGVRI